MDVTEKQVREALTGLQKNQIKQLARSSLHQCSWMSYCCLAHEPNNEQTRARQLTTLLLVMLDQLPHVKTASQEKLIVYQQLLRQRYVEAQSIEQIADEAGVARATIYDRIKRALRVCAQLLSRPPQAAQIASCRHRCSQVRYDAAEPAMQKLLQQLSVYQDAFAIDDLLHAAPRTAHLAQAHRFVVGENDVAIHPQLKRYVARTVSAEHLQRWSEHAAQLCIRQHKVWEAHRYLFQSKQYSESAELLIKNEAKLLQFASLEQLLNTLDSYKPKMLMPTKWAQLKLMAALYANRVQGQQVALSHLNEVLSTHDSLMKRHELQAYKELHTAVVNRDGNRNSALQHFESCLSRVQAVKVDLRDEIQIEALLRRAWLFLNDPVALESAEADLAAAKQLIETTACSTHLKILMHNAEGRLFRTKKQHGQAFAAYEAGLALADQINDIQLKISLIHNLGMLRTRRKHESLAYLQEGRSLADKIGDRSSLAHFDKIIGGYYFHQGNFQLSAQHNWQAYQLFAEIKHHKGLAHTAFDLAEAYIKSGKIESAKVYFEQAQTYAAQQQLHLFQKACRKLASEHPELVYSLSKQQWRILQCLRQHSSMTKSQLLACADLTSSSFLRHVKPLLEQKLVNKAGKGRATQYQLAYANNPI